jgi:Ni/Co efflux regulator RcnB
MKKVILGMVFMAAMSFSFGVSAQDGKAKKESAKTEQCCKEDKEAKACDQKKDDKACTKSKDKKCCSENKTECTKKDAKGKK